MNILIDMAQAKPENLACECQHVKAEVEKRIEAKLKDACSRN
jgi:hypothetical protein